MMDSRIFKGCVETLSIYAEISYHLSYHSSGDQTARDKLNELIADIINQLHTNAKGQIL